MRRVLILSLLTACSAAPSGPVMEPDSKNAAVVAVVACPFATVWQFWLDGASIYRPGEAMLIPDTLTLRFPAARGKHAVEAIRWAPTIRSIRDSVETNEPWILLCQ